MPVAHALGRWQWRRPPESRHQFAMLDLLRPLAAVEAAARHCRSQRLFDRLAELRAAIERAEAAEPRRVKYTGKWPAELRERLAAALAVRPPQGVTLTAIAAEHGVSLGALSKLAKAVRLSVPTGAAARRTRRRGR
jgi:hypothetical protein